MHVCVSVDYFKLEWPFMRAMLIEVWIKLHHMLDKQLLVVL